MENNFVKMQLLQWPVDIAFYNNVFWVVKGVLLSLEKGNHVWIELSIKWLKKKNFNNNAIDLQDPVSL